MTVPKFNSNWSVQMERWLVASIDNMGIEEATAFLIATAYDVCESWGDTWKAERPKSILLGVIERMFDIEDRQFGEEIIEIVKAWSKGEKRCNSCQQFPCRCEEYCEAMHSGSCLSPPMDQNLAALVDVAEIIKGDVARGVENED